MKLYKTERGFGIIKFKDRYGHKCSLQKSSLASEDCIWFGPDEACPQILASQSEKIKRQQEVLLPTLNRKEATTGWVPYPLPKDVDLYTRMHLSRKQVKKLLPHLIKFVFTGEI